MIRIYGTAGKGDRRINCEKFDYPEYLFEAMIAGELKRLNLGDRGNDYTITGCCGTFYLKTPIGKCSLSANDVLKMMHFRFPNAGKQSMRWQKLFHYLDKVPERKFKLNPIGAA